jgi:hypothetical protein
MTDHDDDVMQRLIAADPIDPGRLPSALDPTSRQLLETIMELNQPGSPPATSPADGPVTQLDFPGVPGTERRTRRPRRNVAYLGAVAAAVVLLVAGLAVFTPGSAAPALAAVQSAAQATADADSGRITTTFTVSGTHDDEPGQATGRMEASFSGSDLAFALDLDEVAGPWVPGELPAIEARLVDGVIYVSDGTSWYSVAANGIVGQTVADLVDPRSILPTVQELTETEEVGSAEVDGVTTTQYRSVVDLGDESLNRSGWLAMDLAEVEADGEVVIDLFVDDSDLLRRLDVSGDVSDASNSEDAATFTVSTLFSDFGDEIVIEAPANATEFSPLDHLND